VDIDRPGPHWAADTLDVIARQHPGAELVYLIGGDSLRDLPAWGRPHEFIAKCLLGVMRRPDDAIDLPALEAILPGVTARVRWIDAPPVAIAARDLRDRIRAGRSIRRLVPDAVRDIIEAKGLYAPHS
jgi:nicotinate-nucleotide adenylyltransferase